MKILLIGHGRMGQSIEKLARERKHELVGIIDVDNAGELTQYSGANVDVAIEFTQPDVAAKNINYCLQNHIPVVTGTTGWQDQLSNILEVCNKHEGTFLYASNFSLGVNLFFKMNEWVAKLMNGQAYQVSLEEIHHIHKKDAPSGTAVTLAEGIVKQTEHLNGWTLGDYSPNTMPVKAIRAGDISGTHTVNYRSDVDEITLSHKAYSRAGFVLGAVLVSEWIVNQKGVCTMDDFLSSAAAL